MFENARVAVVIPAYREERLIVTTLRNMPPWVDELIVVDDASPDATAARALEVDDPRLTMLRLERNMGVGAAIVAGYERAMALGADVMVVMAGDNQMDPADLPTVVAPAVRGRADYVKGNRFDHPEKLAMPLARRAVGSLLARCTNALGGLSIHDSQCGYTALATEAARRLPLAYLWPRYGYPNDLLILCRQAGLRIAEVPVRPVYADERSGIRPWHALLVLWVIVRRTLLQSEPLLTAGQRAS